MAQRAREHFLARESVRAAAAVRLRDTKIRFHTAEPTDLQADRVFVHPYVQRPDAAARRRQWSTYHAGRDRLTGSGRIAIPDFGATIACKTASDVLNDPTILRDQEVKWSARRMSLRAGTRDERAQQRPNKRL
jgi:hypothetical protein